MQKTHAHSFPLTHRLALMASRAAELHKIPPEILLRAKHSIADWIGCALAGSSHEDARRLQTYAASWTVAGPCTLLGLPRRASPQAAALLNGFSGHVLDWDDVNIGANVHATAVVLPAVWALAEARRSSGAGLLRAYLAGYDAACLLGRLGGDAHYRTGWHASSVLGVFGAGVGCTALLGTDGRAANAMLGFALAQASGVQAVFGTPGKPFQVARAAEAGLHAALLGEAGMRGSTDALDRERSLAALFGFEHSPQRLNEATVKFAIAGALLKYHASCFVTQGPLEALRELQSRGLAKDNLQSLEVTLAPNAAQVCSIQVPRNGSEMKFSVGHLCAMRLSGIDTGTVEAYTDAIAANTDLRAMASKVRVAADPALGTAESNIEARLADGRELSCRIDMGIAEPDLDRQGRRVEHKFAALACPIMGEKKARRLFESLMHLEQAADFESLS